MGSFGFFYYILYHVPSKCLMVPMMWFQRQSSCLGYLPLLKHTCRASHDLGTRGRRSDRANLAVSNWRQSLGVIR